jgi:hypothetical protein
MAEYIEREAALEECDWYANEFCECEYAIMPLKGALEILPTADVRPVVRGKWELSDDLCWHTCSECGADIDVSVGLLCYVDNEEVCTHNFCPNCGADMREKS